MVGIIITTLFIIGVCILGFMTKKFLYIDEHVASIGNELDTFNHNFKTLEDIDKTSDFKLGNGHLYE